VTKSLEPSIKRWFLHHAAIPVFKHMSKLLFIIGMSSTGPGYCGHIGWGFGLVQCFRSGLDLGCAGFACIFFSLQSEKKIPYFSLSFALSEYERRTLIGSGFNWACGSRPKDKNNQQKKEKVKKFYVLKCWMSLWWMGAKFFNWKTFEYLVIKNLDPDSPISLDPDPDQPCIRIQNTELTLHFLT
jgi:hypothetical protein